MKLSIPSDNTAPKCHRPAKTPPPALLNAAPNEFVWLARMPHPVLEVVVTPQSVAVTKDPVMLSTLGSEVGIVQPGFV